MPEYRLKPGGMHERFLRSRKKIQVIGGGFGNGKTAAACVKALSLIKQYPGCNGLIAMATYSALNDTIREEFYKWAPNSAVERWPTIADNTLRFKNGSVVNFRYLKQKGKSTADGQTVSNLLSATYDWAIVDQIENPEITHKDFLDLLGRLRGSTQRKAVDDTMPVTGPRWLMLTANPSFNWVYHKLIKPWEHYKATGELHPDLIVDPETGEPMIEVFEAPTYENSHNLEPDFIKGLEAAYTGQFRERYLMGKWAAFEGLVYPDFDPSFHMVPQQLMMSYLIQAHQQGNRFESIEAFDFGLASPSCYLIGFIDDVGRIFWIDGFYKREMRLSEIGNNINHLRAKYFPLMRPSEEVIADPDIFKRKIVNNAGYGATTIKDILLDDHSIFCRPGQNDVHGGIAKVAEYLTIKDFPHFLDPSVPGPIMSFSNHLAFVADEFGSYFWKTGQGLERIDLPIDRNDHAMDTIKYGLSYRPQAIELMFTRRFTQDIYYGRDFRRQSAGR